MNSSGPLVSVICLCYNHKPFVKEAIQSVLDQTYKNIELIVVDDASLDGSQDVIAEVVSSHPQISFIALQTNQGNCEAFNCGWRQSKGDFIIDLAADDVLHPERIEKQIRFFRELDSSYGVTFTDAVYIGTDGKPIRNHFEFLLNKRLIRSIPKGEIFREVLNSFFIPGPTMMIRREVLEKLNGYDENLSYEDFDFWVRSSRIYKYGCLDEKLTFIRKVPHSKSSTMYLPGDSQLHSTYLVCRKAVDLCRDDKDRSALAWRVAYEFRQSLFSQNYEEARLFEKLLRELNGWKWSHGFLKMVFSIPLPWAKIRHMYHRIYFG